MKKLSLLVAVIVIAAIHSYAQVGINADNSAPDPTSMLDIKATGKGLLIPRMTQTEIELIPSPANGMIVFCTTNNRFFTYLTVLGYWAELAYGPGYIMPGSGTFACGDPVMVNHLISGGVAPVNKLVTYGTVTNIPGEPSKCWITSNLGASLQASAVNDNTESPAGWYWQFNIKQGYKHDGTTRTPSTAWNNSVNGNQDWQAANDPCLLELGGGWRIPTSTELTNIDATPGWSTWNGPWSSGLKLHAAGYLNDGSGTLGPRGTEGCYWSSKQSGNYYAYNLSFTSATCDIHSGDTKSAGFTVRCIKE